MIKLFTDCTQKKPLDKDFIKGITDAEFAYYIDSKHHWHIGILFTDTEGYTFIPCTNKVIKTFGRKNKNIGNNYESYDLSQANLDLSLLEIIYDNNNNIVDLIV